MTTKSRQYTSWQHYARRVGGAGPRKAHRDLAMLLALPIFTGRDLVRAVRRELLPAYCPRLESALWLDEELVSASDHRGVVLRRDRVDGLLEELSIKCAAGEFEGHEALARRMRALVGRYNGGIREPFRSMEETAVCSFAPLGTELRCIAESALVRVVRQLEAMTEDEMIEFAQWAVAQEARILTRFKELPLAFGLLTKCRAIDPDLQWRGRSSIDDSVREGTRTPTESVWLPYTPTGAEGPDDLPVPSALLKELSQFMVIVVTHEHGLKFYPAGISDPGASGGHAIAIPDSYPLMVHLSGTRQGTTVRSWYHISRTSPTSIGVATGSGFLLTLINGQCWQYRRRVDQLLHSMFRSAMEPRSDFISQPEALRDITSGESPAQRHEGAFALPIAQSVGELRVLIDVSDSEARHKHISVCMGG